MNLWIKVMLWLVGIVTLLNMCVPTGAEKSASSATAPGSAKSFATKYPPPWRDADDPGTLRATAWMMSWYRRLDPGGPRVAGVRRFRSVEEANQERSDPYGRAATPPRHQDTIPTVVPPGPPPRPDEL